MTAKGAPDLFATPARALISTLPCLRCFIQPGIIWTIGVQPIETPWGLIPACEKHRPGAASAFAWEKSGVKIADLAADINAIAPSAPDARLSARRLYDVARNRALGRPDGAPSTVTQPEKKT